MGGNVRLAGIGLREGIASGIAFLRGVSPPSPPSIGIVPRGGWPSYLPGFAGFVTEGSSIPQGLHETTGPMVGGLEADLFQEGDPVSVDGTAGVVDLPGVVETPVVTAFLERPDGRILLLRRSERVGSFRGSWAAVSGFQEEPTPEAQARREVREETGVPPEACRLASIGRPLLARGKDRIFVVHPFRFEVGDVPVRLDWEHTEFEWVDPSEIGRRSSVPKLDRAWRNVAPSR